MGIGSFQPLSANERVEIPNGVDVNPNYCGSTGGFSSHPKPIQFTLRPRAESNSIDFSQSLTQILTSILMLILRRVLMLSRLALIPGRRT